MEIADSAGSDQARRCKIKSDALRLLSFSPRSVVELRQRLLMKKYPESDIDEVIALFQKQGLLNDEKFARLYANSKVHSKPVGRRQLAIDLKRKGLSPELIEKSLSNLPDYDEKSAARELVARRFERMSGISGERKKARLFGFLKRRGFSQEVIYSVLTDLFKGDAANESF